MTPEEQLVHDILVLEERKEFADNEELCKLSKRQIRAVKEYAKE